MRRLLAILLAAAPFAAGAQTTTPLSGEILFDGAAAPVVNRSECQGTGTIGLTWKAVEQTPGVSFEAGKGAYSVYAKATDKTDAFPFCAAVSGTDTPLATYANPASLTVTDPVQVSVSALVTAAGYDCTTANKTIYVCVLWTDGTSTTAEAYAKGTVSLKVVAPNAPTVAKVTVGEEALNVEIDPASSGEAAVTFVAKAVAVDSTSFPGEHRSSSTAVDGKARISGLVNGRDYYVTAFTYSADENESPESARFGPVAPQPVSDAWEYYVDAGGRDSGGCQAGGAGLAALACAAVLVRLRRRS